MSLLAGIDLRPNEIRRAEIGLSTPFPEEKAYIWSQITVPQTGIRKETGGYKPFRIMEQAHNHPAETILPAGGIRGSKSVGGSMELVTWLPHSDLIWIGGERYEDSRQEFEYIMEATVSLGWTDNSLVSFPQTKSQPCTLETYWGALIESKSLSDDDALQSRGPDFILVCEPGKLSAANTYRRAKERLVTRRGKLWMPGTFEDSAPWMETFYRDWVRWPNADNAKSFTVPSYVNRTIFPKGLRDPGIAVLRRSADRDGGGYDEFLRRVVGVPARSPDLIMSDAWKPAAHVGRVEYRRKAENSTLMEPVYVAIDPGYDGDSRYVVLAIQVIGTHIRIFDEVIGKGETHEQLIQKAGQRNWWPAALKGTIDPYAGNSHALGSISPREVWKKEAQVDLVTPDRLAVEELIRRIKSYLTGLNGFTIEVDERCERLRFEMGVWKRIRTGAGLGLPMLKNCDAIKALGYFLTHHYAGRLELQSDEAVVADYNPSFERQGRDPVLMQMEENARFNGAAAWLEGYDTPVRGGLWDG